MKMSLSIKGSDLLCNSNLRLKKVYPLYDYFETIQMYDKCGKEERVKNKI